LGTAIDEAIGAEGLPRPGYEDIVEILSPMDDDDVNARSSRLARAFMDQGVTFDLDGEERPFPLDVVPRIFTTEEWAHIADGLAQRVRALEAFLADVYSSARILDDGVIPHEVVTSSPGFLRAAHGVEPPNGVRIHVAGIDVVRDEHGEFRVLEDNLRCPSGVSYVLANRTAMTRILPELFWGQPIRMVSDYPARLVRALRMAAPNGVTDPTVVVLTPGVHNPAFYEHALLARLMGVHLVEGRDLVCHGTDVFLRTTDGEIPVHVIYRRIDDDFIDPLHFRPDSLLGCPGLLNAARQGRVTLANGVGNGVADDKLVYAYVPDMIRYYLDEEPLLRNVETYPLVDASVRRGVLKRRRELVFKRVDGSGGKDLVIGPTATGDELDAVMSAIESSPRAWIAQEAVALSTAPLWIGGAMQPRHVDLRPFAVNDGERVWVLPGGLTRVALDEGGVIVNSSRGGGSKDTWVVSDGELYLGSGTPGYGLVGDPGKTGGGSASSVERQGRSGEPLDAGPPTGGGRVQQQQQQQRVRARGTALPGNSGR
jgi:uncharacterized circularly permuted ATP-grasp superfamily protein